MIRRNAAVAGFLIGLGVIINTQAANPVLGACLFSFGLLTIIHLGLPLFTGRVGFIGTEKGKNLIPILFFNLIGILICFILYSYKNQAFYQILLNKSLIKFDKTFLQLFINGIFCGTLIHFAVRCKEKIMTIMAIMIFILIGAEHCIADFPYFIVNLSIENFLKFLTIIMGNSCGAFFIENMLKKEGK